MEYTKKDLTFIIYNNRSPRLVKKFLSDSHLDINRYKLIKIEKIITEIKSKYIDNSKDLVFNLNDIDLDKEDLIYGLEDINSFKEIFLGLMGVFSERETDYLKNRSLVKISNKLIGLDKILELDLNLDVLGISIHPTLLRILKNGNNGGIIIPLFENNNLINLAVRRIGITNTQETKTLKYSLACPDIDVWGLDNINMGDEIWITEGIFDMYALIYNGLKAISVSSPYWSSIQLYKLLQKKPTKVNIFSDNDKTGIISSIVISNFLDEYEIENEIFISYFAKDASEHFFEKNYLIKDLKELEYKKIYNNRDNYFSYTEYLKNRKFN
jgi:hypothetical protein